MSLSSHTFVISQDSLRAPADGSSADMIRGLYRTRDLMLGDAVRVHWSAGDAAPIVSAAIYEAVGGTPPLADLPERDGYIRHTAVFEGDPFELS